MKCEVQFHLVNEGEYTVEITAKVFAMVLELAIKNLKDNFPTLTEDDIEDIFIFKITENGNE